MGESVAGLATMILEKLATKAYQEVASAWGLKADVKRLQDSMKIINNFLADAESKQYQNHAITEWLQQLKDAFYDARDLLHEIECEALRKQLRGNTRKVRRFFSNTNSLAFRFKMAHRIKDMKERMDKIADYRMKFDLSPNHTNDNLPLIQKMPWRETHSFVDSSRVIGRDEEREKIVKFLMSPRSRVDKIDVISIVGIGGLGKTTLAQLVYNDERVKGLFQLRMWVCVSDEFDLRRLTLEILKAAEETISDNLNFSLDQLQSLLREKLHAKKFLLVLDDVWNESSKKWFELRDILLDIQNNSKIIVTTRSRKVVSIMGTVPELNLEELLEEECMKLFVKCAFQAGEEKKHPRLVKIGKEIVKKCRGVPLAVETLGCLLHSELNENKWREVRDSEIWKIDQENDGIMPALRLSYNHLPTQLKQCFSYCSTFPKDYEFDTIDLVAFWMAHGLLLSRNENEEVEDLGKLYIQEFISRSFFQIEYSYNDFKCVLKMHDLFHDLAMSTMQSEQAVVTFDSTSSFSKVKENVRHISFSNSNGVPTFPHRLRKVQTVGFWHSIGGARNITEPFVKWISSECRYLKVLDLQGSTLQSLPDCFDRMKHLRYLNLSHCKMITRLPNSICKLQNLQVLILGCRALQELPKDMKNLVSLRILRLTLEVKDLSHYYLGCYKSLQALYIYSCGNLVSLPSELGNLSALKRLLIWNCRALVSFEDREKEQNIEVVKDLNLRLLAISDLPKLVGLPGWLKRSARTLQCMRLAGCSRLKALPEWLPNITSLETLLIDDCPKLSAFPEGMDMLHKLQKLEITNCPKLYASCKEKHRRLLLTASI